MAAPASSSGPPRIRPVAHGELDWRAYDAMRDRKIVGATSG